LPYNEEEDIRKQINFKLNNLSVTNSETISTAILELLKKHEKAYEILGFTIIKRICLHQNGDGIHLFTIVCIKVQSEIQSCTNFKVKANLIKFRKIIIQ